MNKAELKAKIEALQAEYDAMPDEVVLNARADKDQKYFYLNTASRVFYQLEETVGADRNFHNIGNYYLSETVANRAADYYKKWGQFNRVAFELMGGEPEVDWSDAGDTHKYCVLHDSQRNEWRVESWRFLVKGAGHYFTNNKTAQRLVDWANENGVKP